MNKLRCSNKECRDNQEEDMEPQFIIGSVQIDAEGQVQQFEEIDASDFECCDCCGKAEWVEDEEVTGDVAKEVETKTAEITDEQINAIGELIGYCSDSSEFDCFLECLLDNMDLDKYGVTEEDTEGWRSEEDIPKEVLADAPNTVYKEAMIAQEFINNINQEDT